MACRILIAASVLPLALLSQGAAAQIDYREAPAPYLREGQPAVQSPAPPPVDPRAGIRSRFRAAYLRAKSPRIVIFWNREFTDEVGTSYDIVQQQESSGKVRRHNYSSSSETRLGIRSNTETRRYSANDEIGDFDTEQGFAGTLSREGVRLIDRTAIMRTTGVVKGADEGSNIQGLETEAILAKADIIVEVSQLGAHGDAIEYKVVARDLRQSRILTAFRTDGRPPAQAPRYVAGDHGFELAAPEGVSDARTGSQIATEFMSRVSNSF